MGSITFAIGRYVKTPNERLSTITTGLAKLEMIFSNPAPLADKLKSPYYLRCQATQRNNKSVSNNASLVLIDGDSRIDWLGTGEIIEGTIEPELVHYCLKAYGINHLMYSSYSHGKIGIDGLPMTKWRAVIPCNYPRDRLTDCITYLINLLHENELFCADVKENHTYSQAWFMPCLPTDRVGLFQFFSFIDGNNLLIDDVPMFEKLDVKGCTNRVNFNNGQVLLSPKPNEQPPKQKPARTNSPISAFNALHTVHDVLNRNGYKRASNGKYLCPHSSTKEAGVAILTGDDGIERVYSHHGSDPLNDGSSHDAFGCFRILEYGGDMRAMNWDSELTRKNREAWKKQGIAGLYGSRGSL
jgi:hypothetical protein